MVNDGYWCVVDMWQLFQLKCLVLVNFFGLQLRKTFFNYKNTLELFFLLSTMFYSQVVIENIVAKGGGGVSINDCTSPSCSLIWTLEHGIILSYRKSKHTSLESLKALQKGLAKPRLKNVFKVIASTQDT